MSVVNQENFVANLSEGLADYQPILPDVALGDLEPSEEAQPNAQTTDSMVEYSTEAAEEYTSLEALAANCYQQFYNYALRRTHSPEDAAELVQETLARVQARLNENSKISTNLHRYTFRALNHNVTSWTRAQYYRNHASLEKPVHSNLGNLTHEEYLLDPQDGEWQAGQMEARELLAGILAALPERQRDLIILANHHGYSYATIARLRGYASAESTEIAAARARARAREIGRKLMQHM